MSYRTESNTPRAKSLCRHIVSPLLFVLTENSLHIVIDYLPQVILISRCVGGLLDSNFNLVLVERQFGDLNHEYNLKSIER